MYNFEYVFSTSYRSRNDELFFWFIILVIARIGEKRPIVDLFITIVFVLCIFCISYFRLQIWCQALQSLTTYRMLTTYSWMLCEGAYLRFILVFDEHITTSRLLKIWIYIMDYFLLIFNLFEISNSYCETNLRRIFLLNYINLYHWKFVEPSWGDISFRRIMIYMNRSKAK